MNTGCKIYAGILRERIEKYVEEEEKLSDTQWGFRSGRGTVYAIYLLKKAISKEIQREKGKSFLLFANLLHLLTD